MNDVRSIAQHEMDTTRSLITRFHWEDRQTYSVWLAQTYHIVKHSTRLVALASAYTDLSQNELHVRFIDHAKEERGHELICLSDLKEMRLKIEDQPVLYPPIVMHQIQYYWVQHRGPLSLFGYILSLECMAARFGQEIYERAAKAHGKNASKFLKVHAQDDVDHIEKAFEQIRALPQIALASVIENLRLSSALYRALLTEVEVHVRSMPLLKVA